MPEPIADKGTPDGNVFHETDFRTARLLLLVLLPALGCQATASHNYRTGEFTHSLNFGQGEINAESGTMESKGLSVPGLNLVTKILDVGLNLTAAILPGFIGNALTQTPNVVPEHVHHPEVALHETDQSGVDPYNVRAAGFKR
jgi:hypothetical protein